MGIVIDTLVNVIETSVNWDTLVPWTYQLCCLLVLGDISIKLVAIITILISSIIISKLGMDCNNYQIVNVVHSPHSLTYQRDS